jgi:hypothetical protein
MKSPLTKRPFAGDGGSAAFGYPSKWSGQEKVKGLIRALPRAFDPV